MLLVVMMIPLSSAWMKSAIMLDQIFLRAQFIFMTCILESSINFLASSLFIGMITCLQDRLFVVMLIFSLDLTLVLLMIFWTKSIFLFDIKIKEWELSFLFYFLSHFIFQVILYFSIPRTLRLWLEVIGHTVTSVTSDRVVTTLIIGLKRRK